MLLSVVVLFVLFSSTRSHMSCALLTGFLFCFFKQKTAYEMRISNWSSDVCSSDLLAHRAARRVERRIGAAVRHPRRPLRIAIADVVEQSHDHEADRRDQQPLHRAEARAKPTVEQIGRAHV